MLTPVIAYGFTLLVFIALDAVWLTTMGQILYKPTLNPVLADQVRLGPAIVFYLLYPVGTVAFSVLPALKSDSVSHAIIYAALYGVLAYATYDLTNFATLKVWSTTITVADMAWGAFASAVSASAAFYLTRWVEGMLAR